MQALFDLLGRFPQPLLVIGGHALAAHGVARQTVDVDLLFVDAPTFDRLESGGVPLQRGRVTLHAPALPHLIALKLHAIRNNPAREAGDLGDIARLLHANREAIAANELAALCEQFGPPGINAKLQTLLAAP